MFPVIRYSIRVGVLIRAGHTKVVMMYIDDEEEAIACFGEMTNDCVAVTSITIDEEECAGLTYNKSKIMVEARPGSDTLVHEVGHTKGLYDLEATVYRRIMNPTSSSSNCRVIASEKNDYEDL